MTPVRVLIVGHTNTLGGVETFIKNIVVHSDRERVSFDLLIHDGSGSCQFEKEIRSFYKDDDRQRIIHVSPIKRNPIACIGGLFKIRAEHKGDYDWIHLNTGAPTEIVYCLPLLVNTNARLITHSHIGGGKENSLNDFCRYLINRLSNFRLACSDLAATWLFGNKSAQEILMVKNGVDAREFAYSDVARKRIRESLGIGQEKVIGHIGRFADLKNHPRILSIFYAFQKKFPNSILCLVGQGELYGETVSRCEQLGLQNSVKFLGARSDTNELYSAFDVFLMPSLYEGLPMVLVEAQMSGLPIVISSSISEDACIMGDLCQVLDLSDDDDQWAEALGQAHCQERKGYSRKMEAAGFGISSIVDGLEALYEGDDTVFGRIVG